MSHSLLKKSLVTGDEQAIVGEEGSMDEREWSSTKVEGPQSSDSESGLGFWLVVAALLFIGFQLWQQRTPALKKGALAPGLELLRLSDNQRFHETWKGKVTVLHFWASW